MELKSFHEDLVREQKHDGSYLLKRPECSDSFIAIELKNDYEFFYAKFFIEFVEEFKLSTIFIQNWEWKKTKSETKIIKKNDHYFEIICKIPKRSHLLIFYDASFTIQKFCMKEYFTTAVSLGTWCMASQYLKHAGIKKESYPFDWIKSSYDIIADCIDTNFQNFLNKKYLEYICISQYPQVNHLFYYIDMFWHHDPLNSSKDEMYFERCIQRFESLYDNDQLNVIFLSIFHERPTMREINRIERCLKLKIKHFKLIILYNIEYNDEKIWYETDDAYYNERNIQLYKLYSDKFIHENWHGMNTYTTIDKIFEQFKFI